MVTTTNMMATMKSTTTTMMTTMTNSDSLILQKIPEDAIEFRMHDEPAVNYQEREWG